MTTKVKNYLIYDCTDLGQGKSPKLRPICQLLPFDACKETALNRYESFSRALIDNVWGRIYLYTAPRTYSRCGRTRDALGHPSRANKRLPDGRAETADRVALSPVHHGKAGKGAS